MGCAGKTPAPKESTPTPPVPTPEPRDTVAAKTPAPPPVAPSAPRLAPDSVGPEPRPSILVEKHDMKSVRTRMIPRVMGRGWTLSVNKGDSIEFLRHADPELTAFLFNSPPVPAARIRLRFRLKQDKQGIVITSVAHLVGTTVYPYRAVSKVLEDNLAELRDDLLAGPSTLAPIIDRVDKKKKKP